MAELFICPRCTKSHRKGWYLETRVYRCERCGYIGRGYHRISGLDASIGAAIDQMMASLRSRRIIDVHAEPPPPYDIALLQPREDVDFRAAVREFDRHIERLLCHQAPLLTRPSIGRSAEVKG